MRNNQRSRWVANSSHKSGGSAHTSTIPDGNVGRITEHHCAERTTKCVAAGSAPGATRSRTCTSGVVRRSVTVTLAAARPRNTCTVQSATPGMDACESVVARDVPPARAQSSARERAAPDALDALDAAP